MITSFLLSGQVHIFCSQVLTVKLLCCYMSWSQLFEVTECCWILQRLLINTYFTPPDTFSVYLPLTEWHMGGAVFLCAIQSHEPHVVYRVRCPGSRRDDWCVAHHAQYDRRCHLLRHVYWPRHRSHPVTGLLTTTVPRKGETWRSSICYCIHLSQLYFL